MKTLSPSLQAHLDGSATTLCFCWTLRRADGMAFGFTDHDRDLEFDGITYEAASGFTATAIEGTLGLAVDNLDVLGALNSARLTDADIAAGLYDDAQIEIWRVNWQAPAERTLLRSGNLGEVRRGATAFAAEVRGLSHRLNQPIGRLYQYACDADLGDARCGVDLGDPLHTGVATIVGADQDRIFTLSGLDAFADRWFERGVMTMTAGANAGAAREIKRHTASLSGTQIELWQRFAEPVAPGDTAQLQVGCDKQLATCRAKFANVANYRGFPHMPGNDFVQSYPAGSDDNDGGSRQGG